MRNRGAQILWLVILLALLVAMGILLIGGDILIYLSPRMVPIAWFGFLAIAALAVFQLWQIGTSPAKGGKIWLGSLVFLIPLVLLLTVPPDDTTSGTLPNQNIKLLNLVKENTAPSVPTGEKAVQTEAPSAVNTPEATQTISPSPTSSASAEGDEPSREQPTAPVDTIDASQAEPCTLKGGTLSFDASADKFSDYLYDSPEDLAGQEMTLYGFVYKDASFPENVILISRLYISCCAADGSIVGFHVKVNNADDYKDNDWICVQGTAASFSFDYEGAEYNLPLLTDGTVTRCDPPDTEDAYIYP